MIKEKKKFPEKTTTGWRSQSGGEGNVALWNDTATHGSLTGIPSSRQRARIYIISVNYRNYTGRTQKDFFKRFYYKDRIKQSSDERRKTKKKIQFARRSENSSSRYYDILHTKPARDEIGEITEKKKKNENKQK